MKYLVQFQLKPGCKNQAVEHFEQRGPNRHPGVTYRGAWIGAEADVAFILVESPDVAHVEGVAQTWRDFGSSTITPVIDLEQF